MQKFSPLTYGQVKASKELADALVAPGLDVHARTEAAIAFLKVAEPNLDADAETPGALLKAAEALYVATFARPEDPAPVQQNP